MQSVGSKLKTPRAQLLNTQSARSEVVTSERALCLRWLPYRKFIDGFQRVRLICTWLGFETFSIVLTRLS